MNFENKKMKLLNQLQFGDQSFVKLIKLENEWIVGISFEFVSVFSIDKENWKIEKIDELKYHNTHLTCISNISRDELLLGGRGYSKSFRLHISIGGGISDVRNVKNMSDVTFRFE